MSDALLTAKPTPRLAAGFWPRAGALLLDAAVLYFASSLIGSSAYAPLMALNPYLPWIAAAVMVLYFTLAESRIGGGQTLGKLIFRLRTVELAPPGEPARAPASGAALLRAVSKGVLLALVMDLQGFALIAPPAALPAWTLGLALLRVFSLALLIAQVTAVLMDPRRRALHDLLGGTRVIRVLEPGNLAEDPEPNPVEASRARLAQRFGLFALFTSFMLLAVAPVQYGWLHEQARTARAQRAELAPHLRIGPYIMLGVSLPSAERTQSFEQRIVQIRTTQVAQKQTVESTETLQRVMNSDPATIYAIYERTQGSVPADFKPDAAMLAQVEALRAAVWNQVNNQPASDAPRAQRFQCFMAENLRLLYYSHIGAHGILQFSGPADPAQGPLAFEIVLKDAPTAASPAATPAAVPATAATTATAPLTPDRAGTAGMTLDADAATTH